MDSWINKRRSAGSADESESENQTDAKKTVVATTIAQSILTAGASRRNANKKAADAGFGDSSRAARATASKSNKQTPPRKSGKRSYSESSSSGSSSADESEDEQHIELSRRRSNYKARGQIPTIYRIQDLNPRIVPVVPSLDGSARPRIPVPQANGTLIHPKDEDLMAIDTAKSADDVFTPEWFDANYLRLQILDENPVYAFVKLAASFLRMSKIEDLLDRTVFDAAVESLNAKLKREANELTVQEKQQKTLQDKLKSAVDLVQKVRQEYVILQSRLLPEAGMFASNDLERLVVEFNTLSANSSRFLQYFSDAVAEIQSDLERDSTWLDNLAGANRDLKFRPLEHVNNLMTPSKGEQEFTRQIKEAVEYLFGPIWTTMLNAFPFINGKSNFLRSFSTQIAEFSNDNIIWSPFIGIYKSGKFLSTENPYAIGVNPLESYYASIFDFAVQADNVLTGDDLESQEQLVEYLTEFGSMSPTLRPIMNAVIAAFAPNSSIFTLAFACMDLYKELTTARRSSPKAKVEDFDPLTPAKDNAIVEIADTYFGAMQEATQLHQAKLFSICTAIQNLLASEAHIYVDLRLGIWFVYFCYVFARSVLLSLFQSLVLKRGTTVAKQRKSLEDYIGTHGEQIRQQNYAAVEQRHYEVLNRIRTQMSPSNSGVLRIGYMLHGLAKKAEAEIRLYGVLEYPYDGWQNFKSEIVIEPPPQCRDCEFRTLFAEIIQEVNNKDSASSQKQNSVNERIRESRDLQDWVFKLGMFTARLCPKFPPLSKLTGK